MCRIAHLCLRPLKRDAGNSVSSSIRSVGKEETAFPAQFLFGSGKNRKITATSASEIRRKQRLQPLSTRKYAKDIVCSSLRKGNSAETVYPEPFPSAAASRTPFLPISIIKKQEKHERNLNHQPETHGQRCTIV